ncbi:fas-binding factor 1 isoform X4 [Sorex araneus]|uniref:fas-binding factor 1 isoform X4 n=1 Tax=Sorex araneus TaxID=42254 RepID=UPI002433FE74|nr:fas-binding factor 1 isoform X4 [Sorex araneus]
MAPKARKGLKGSIDDVLGGLLEDDGSPLEQPVRLTPHPERPRAGSLLGASALGAVAGLADAKAQDSDVSEADPQDLLQSLDLDEMDADLLGLRKPALAPGRAATKGPREEELPGHRQAAGGAIPSKKPPGKFSFEDVEDPLAGLLSDVEDGAEKPLVETEIPAPVRDPGPSVPLTPGETPVRKKQDLFDDGDDVMATLEFGDSPPAERRPLGDQEAPRPARSKLDELLGRSPAAALLGRPATGERREFKLDKKYQRPQASPGGSSPAPTPADKAEPWANEDFTFGAYQPTVGSARGRQPRRQSVSRFSEGGADPQGEPGPGPAQPRKGGADWLGLKDDDGDLSPTGPSMDAGGALPPAGSQRAPPGRPTSGPRAPTQSPASPTKGGPAPRPGASDAEDTEDWLSHALSRKRAQGLARDDPAAASRGPSSAAGPPYSASPRMASAPKGVPETALQEPPARPAPLGPSAPRRQAAAAPGAGDPEQGAAPGRLPSPEPAGSSRSLLEPAEPSVPSQPLRSLVPAPGSQKQLPAAQAQLQGGAAELQAQLLQSQARQAELETQVRKLELEREQQQLLLESLQRRHQADLELLESAHRNRLKVLETSCQQREERLQRENQELSARCLAHSQEAEQACAELSAQHQRRLAATLQEKDQELERLRELQRASILEMRKDHEEQLQRLKQLKDREIDAVTSATSHTRSLNGVIEQMEVFSNNLQELSSRVEASHLTATQERELGIRQRDEQLRVLQERLAREQRDMEEERSRLQEVIGRMETRLNEQSRQLEQERWRMSTEQSKAESMQRALEEQRKALGQQMAMEREELEKAKSALLQEQKSVMHKCGEERRRLAAEWAEFFAQQKLSKERAEREVERALQVDSQREGTLLSLAKVASEKYEEGERALREARHMRSEQQARLQLVQQQQERLRQQEQHMHQEHLSLAQQRLQLDRVRQDLPSCPAGLLPKALSPTAPSLSALAVPAPKPPAPGPAHLQAKLLLLRHAAEQDHDFLENEQFFLQTLKAAPYNLSTHSA